MAVNDLMMRIQLLVNSGKSSDELRRVSKSLTDFNKKLESIGKSKLDLKDQIAQFVELQASLKKVNAQTYVKELANVESAFNKLSLDTKSINDLRKTFNDLELKKAAQQANDFSKQIRDINAQIKEARQYGLRSAYETPQSAIAGLRQLKIERQQYNNDIKKTVGEINAERGAIIDLNRQIKDSANLYAAKRTTDDPSAKSLIELARQLAKDESKLSGWNRQLNNAKASLQLTKDALKEVRSESKQLGQTKLLEFGLQQSDIANVQRFLGSIGKSINVAEIQKARDELLSLKDQIKNQQQLIKDTQSLSPLATGDLEKTKGLLRENTVELSKQAKAISEQKQLRAQALLLTDSEYQKVLSLRSANEQSKKSIADYVTSAKQASQFITDFSQQIRGLKFNASLAKGLQLQDQSGQLSQLNAIRDQLKAIDVGQLTKLREQIRLLQQGGGDGTFTFINKNNIEGQRDSIRKINEDIRNLRQQLRVEGQPNLINFKDSSGQVRNLISDVTTLKNNILQLKQFSAGEGTIKVSQENVVQKNALNEQIAAQKKLNDGYALTSATLGTIKSAYEQYNEAAKKGDTTARANIESAIKSYNTLNKALGENKGEGLQFGLKTDTAIKQISDLEKKILGLSTAGVETFKKLNNDITNIKPIEINQSITLSGLNRIQKAIRDVKAEQQAFKLENIVPLDAKTNVYAKEMDALKLLRREVKAYNEEINNKQPNQIKLTANENNIRAIREELTALANAGKFSKTVLDNIFSGGSVGDVNKEKLREQLSLLERQTVFGKLNSSLLSQQNAERSKELANLVRQEAIGKNNIANIKDQLDQVNQLVTAERNRAKSASQDIKSNQINTKLGELNSLKAMNDELKAVLNTEQQRRQGLRETAKLLLDQGKSRALDFTAQIPGLQSLVNLNRDAKVQAEGQVKSLKEIIQSRKDEITELGKQKQLVADHYQRELDKLNATKATTEATKAANEATKQGLLLTRNQQQAKIDIDIAAAKSKLSELESILSTATTKFNDLRKAAQQSAKEAENLAKADVAGRQQSIQRMDQMIGKIKERVKSDEQAIKAYKEGIKEYENGLRAEIAAANQRIATGQLTKAQYEEEKKNINNLIKERQNYSKEYIKTLQDAKASKQLELATEREAIRALEQQAKALQGVAKAQVESEIAQRRSALSKQGGTESQVRTQIQETNALARAELERLATLEKIAQQSNSLSSIFRRINGSASVEPAIQATQNLITNVTKQLTDLATRSNEVKQRLSTMGSTSDLPKITQQAKDVATQLIALRNASKTTGLSPSQANDYISLGNTLKNLNEQKRLLKEIASIDTKTQAGQIELKGLNENLRGLRSYAAEMGRVQRFMTGFGFNLTAEMLGQSVFQTVTNTIQQMGRAFIEANSKAETLIRGLDAVFGKGQGDVQYEKLTALANKYGLGLQDLSRNYLQLNASAKGTQLEGAESEKIFTSLSAAMAVLGADTITTQRAFRSISQMISKGQVYSEELKGQLAEALPGAVQLFARSMGKTTQEFLAMTKAGQVGLNELIPFFKLVEQEYGNAATASTTYEQATNRLGNAWILLMKNIGDSGIWKTIVAGIDIAGQSVFSLSEYVKAANKDFGDFIKYTQGIGKVTTLSVGTDKKPIDDYFDYFLNSATKVYSSLASQVGKSLFPIIGNLDTIVGNAASSTQGLFDYFAKPTTLLEKWPALTQEAYNNMKQIQDASPESVSGWLGSFDEENARREQLNRVIEEENARRAEGNAIKLAERIRVVESTQAYKDNLKAFEARMNARGGYNEPVNDNNANDQIKLNKKYIKSITDELKIQQQAYSNLNAVQGKLASSELKRLQAIGGIDKKTNSNSNLVVDEIKNSIALANAQTALNRAREIENAIITGNKEDSKNTRQEEANALRNLTLQQLQHSMTLARSANNQNLILAIMREQTRVMRDLRLTSPEFNVDVFSGLSGVSEEVKNKIKGIQEELKASATATGSVVSQMSKVLSLMEQRKRLTALQTNNQAGRQVFEQQVGWERELFAIESKRMSEKAKARRILAIAEKAYTAAQEQFSIAQTSQDPEQIERAKVAYEAIMGTVESLTGKIEQAGSAGRKFVEKVSNLKIEAGQLTFNFNDQALNAEIKRIDGLISKSTNGVGKFDIDVGVKTATDNLNLLQNKYIELKNQLETASGENKTAIERQIQQILPEISLAEQELIQMGQQFQALNIGKPIVFTIDKTVQQDLEKLKGTLDGILLNKPLTFGTLVPEEPAKAQVEAARAAMQAKADEKAITFKTVVGTTTQPVAINPPVAISQPTEEPSSYWKDTATAILDFFIPAANAAQDELQQTGVVFNNVSSTIQSNPIKPVVDLSPSKGSIDQLKSYIKNSFNEMVLDAYNAQQAINSANKNIDDSLTKSMLGDSLLGTYSAPAKEWLAASAKEAISVQQALDGVNKEIDKTLIKIAFGDSLLGKLFNGELKIEPISIQLNSNFEQIKNDLLTLPQSTASTFSQFFSIIGSSISQSIKQSDLYKGIDQALATPANQWFTQQQQNIATINQDYSGLIKRINETADAANQPFNINVFVNDIGLDATKTKFIQFTNLIKQPVVINTITPSINTQPAQTELQTLQARIDAIQQRMQELQSQQPQGIVAGNVSPDVQNRSSELAKLRTELVALQSQLNLINSKSISPKVDTQQIKQATNSIQQFANKTAGAWKGIEVQQGVVTSVERLSDSVTRFSAAGKDVFGKALKFDIPNFQIQPNSITTTFNDIVREGNRYLSLNKMKVQLEAEGASKEVVTQKIQEELNRTQKPLTFNPAVELKIQQENVKADYQKVVQEFGKGDPIQITGSANQLVGEIQAELAALQNSGATNIKVTLDQESGQLVVTADTSQADAQVNDIIRRIESSDVVLNVKLNVDQSALRGVRGSAHIPGFASGGQIPGGYSTKDSFLAMLSPGEFVIPSSIVKQYGAGYFNNMIKGQPKTSVADNIHVPHFTNGGLAGSATTVNINFGSAGKFSLSGSRDQVTGFTKALQSLSRTL